MAGEGSQGRASVGSLGMASVGSLAWFPSFAPFPSFPASSQRFLVFSLSSGFPERILPARIPGAVPAPAASFQLSWCQGCSSHCSCWRWQVSGAGGPGVTTPQEMSSVPPACPGMVAAPSWVLCSSLGCHLLSGDTSFLPGAPAGWQSQGRTQACRIPLPRRAVGSARCRPGQAGSGGLFLSIQSWDPGDVPGMCLEPGRLPRALSLPVCLSAAPGTAPSCAPHPPSMVSSQKFPVPSLPSSPCGWCLPWEWAGIIPWHWMSWSHSMALGWNWNCAIALGCAGIVPWLWGVLESFRGTGMGLE